MRILNFLLVNVWIIVVCPVLVQIADSLHQGSLSASELCELCLRRLNKTKELNAFITPLPDSARQSAKDAQQRISKGLVTALSPTFMQIKKNIY